MKPKSCDTFVALAPATADGYVVFGKNSDRPSHEVQEVLHLDATDHPAGSKVQVSLPLNFTVVFTCSNCYTLFTKWN